MQNKKAKRALAHFLYARIRGRAGRLIRIGLLTAFALASAGPAAGQTDKLPSSYRVWLDEDVPYIITPLEREVFLKLQTNRERDLFIEAFWKHREPAAGGSGTSYKTEHYRRIATANRTYGRTSTLQGWKTDRGRIYILLGEPQTVQKFETRSDVVPTEVWFYQNKESLGLPTGFYVVFFQEHGSGDYKLYSPSQNGPQALMTSYFGNAVDYGRAYQALNEISPDLASVSMSLIPGENAAASGRPALSSDLLLQKIETSPRRQVEETYARKFLEFKDVVDVEYSTNFLASDSTIKLLRDPGGLYFVHYAVEPARLSVEKIGDKYAAALKINGSVTAPGGALIYQFEKTASVSLTEAQVRDAGWLKFDFHDMFPLIAGTYKISVLIKNEASKEFTSLEENLLVPGDAPGLMQMTAPILAYKTARAEDATRQKPFRLGATQLYVQPNRTFSRSETLGVGFQVFGLSAGQKGKAKLRYIFRRDQRIVLSRERGIADYAALPDILEEFPLTDFVPAHYTLEVTGVVDGQDAVTAKDEFDISQQAILPRPWFYSKLMPPASDPYYGPIVGGQLLSAGRLADALELYERTIARFGVSAPLLNGLGDCRAALGRPQEALAAWEQSLKIDLLQADIRKKLEALRKKK
jgi:GWxTD domain-containing protein